MKNKDKQWLPCIGYGTFPQKDSLISNIPYALKNGYRLIDTSDNYCNEENVGEGLLTICDADYVIVSKFSQPFRTAELDLCFEESKSKLNNRLDIYLLHWPYPFLWKDAYKRMEELYLAGKCNAIGVCNFDLEHLKELLSFCRIKPIINQLEHHPMFQQNEILKFCEKNNIKVMSYSPLARMDIELHTNKVLIELGKKYNKSVSQIILRWNIDTNCIPIPGSSTPERITENYNIFDFFLTKKEIEQINRLECGKRIRFNPRTRFTIREKFRMFLYKVINL